MTTEQKRRELFEAYCVSDAGGYCKEHLERDAEGNYTVVWEYWAVWSAALDAVVIELPNDHGPVGAFYSDGVDDCRAAIESTCLGLKVLP